SSSCVSARYSGCLLMEKLLDVLCDVAGLLCVRVGERVVREDIRSDGRVDRSGDVRVDQRHRGALRKLLAGDRVELLTAELSVLGLVLLPTHVDPPRSC